MLPEISLHILDIVQNSITAHAKRIEIGIRADTEKDFMQIQIKDDGKGMGEDQLQNAADPFYTTRTTRKTGLGLPFFKYAAESTGGDFTLRSRQEYGTEVLAGFVLSSIDRMPLGSMPETVHLLLTTNPQIDFMYSCWLNGRGFTFDTQGIRKIMGNIPLSTPEVSSCIKDYLMENQLETDPEKIL